MTSHFRRRFASVARLLVLAGTSYFLVATSYEPPHGDPMPYPAKLCYHATETLTFQVTGTCGPEGSITVTSPKDECAVAITGASAVGLPSAGRFDGTDDGAVSLARSPWSLSGFLPERQVPAETLPQADAGPFAVVGQDAQAGKDISGSSAVTGQHLTPLVRTCSYQIDPSTSVPPILKCSGGGAPECQAVLEFL